MELMLEKGAEPNYVVTKYFGEDDDRTALHFACGTFLPVVPAIRLLCDWGADVNAVSRTNAARSPLHMAAHRGWAGPAAVSALVVAGADPFLLDAEGRTVVEAMVERGDVSSKVEVLLDSRPSRF